MSCDKCPTRSSTVYANVTVIGGLTPGVEYKLNIAAVNVFGRGSDSPTVTAQSATPGVHHKLSIVRVCIRVFPIMNKVNGAATLFVIMQLQRKPCLSFLPH